MRKLRLWVAVAAAGVCVRQDSAAQSGEVAPATPVVVETPSPAAGVVKAGNPLWAIPLSTLSATRDRPLFSSSRRPAPLAVAAAPPPSTPILAKPVAPSPPPFTLLGTIIGGGTRLAVFLNDQSKAVTRIREGESDSGWTLRSVDPRSAILENDGRMVTVEFPVVSGSPAPVVASSAPQSVFANGQAPAGPSEFSKKRLPRALWDSRLKALLRR
jgi:hypothetical protein